MNSPGGFIGASFGNSISYCAPKGLRPSGKVNLGSMGMLKWKILSCPWTVKKKIPKNSKKIKNT
jgi:hypothetical protein